MSGRQSAVGGQRHKKMILVFLLLLLLLFTIHYSLFTVVYGAESEKWQGIDESVVKKIAKEQGREAREPLINTDQGDVLLFVFLIAGAVGGFIAGYSWRKLTEDGARKGQGTKTDGTLL